MSKITDFGEWKFERLRDLIFERIRKDRLGEITLTSSMWVTFINQVKNEAEQKKALQRKEQAKRRFTVRDKRGVIDNE